MKKIAVMILSVMLCTMLSAVVNAELMGDDTIIDTGPIFGESSGKGDVNNDGSINSEDITALANALASGTANSLDAANVYTDDETDNGAIINIKDLIYLSQYVSRTENVFKPQGIISNLAIPVADENGEFLKSEYNSNEGLFVHVLADGELLWIQLDEDVQAGIYPSIKDSEEFDKAYSGKPCSAVQLLNGNYALISLSYNVLEDGTYAGLNKDENELENAEDSKILYTEDGIKRILFFEGTASCFRDYTPTSLCNFDFTLTNHTIIIVKNIKNKGSSNEAVEYIHYDKDVFSHESLTLYNASVILQNNPESTVENALVIYAEKEDYSPYFQSERIISYSDVNVENGNLYYNYYTVFNPYTGRSEEIRGTLPGTNAASVANGAFPTGTRVKNLCNSIYENEGYVEEDIIDVDTDFVWLIDYDTENQTITVLPEGSADEGDAVTYVYTDNTAFSKLDHTTKNNLFKCGIMSSLDAETLFRHINSNDYKCYKDNVLVGDTYQTKYAKYIKMYVSPIENTNVLDYAIVIVHDDEAEENLNM